MINFTLIKAEIDAFVPALSGLPASACRWRDESEGSTWAQGPTLWMRVQNTDNVGIEEEISTSGHAPGADQIVTLSGQRTFVWNLRAESFDEDIASSAFAGNIMDRLKLRLMRSTSIWARTSFAIVDRMMTQWFSYKDSGRQVSCYTMDVRCATVDVDIDTTRGAGGWINSAHVTGTIDGDEQVNTIITGDG